MQVPLSSCQVEIGTAPLVFSGAQGKEGEVVKTGWLCAHELPVSQACGPRGLRAAAAMASIWAPVLQISLPVAATDVLQRNL